MAEVARLIGGAGTGKTTELLRIIERVRDAGISDPHQIGFVSFTRAARREAAQRAGDLFNVSPHALERDGWFRTLHSVAMACLGLSSDQLLTGGAETRDWLREHVDPRCSGDGGDEDVAIFETAYEKPSHADRALAIWSLARNQMRPLDDVWTRVRRIDDEIPPLTVCRRIVAKYETRKQVEGRRDFVDILAEFGGVGFLEDGSVYTRSPRGKAPSIPVWIFDEQQDASPLLDRVCHRLVEHPACRWAYVAADPFQSIYAFAGASPDHFMAWPAAKERTMPQTWRCPAPIQALGERILSRCRNYFDRGIAPANHEGRIERLPLLDALTPRIDPGSGESWLLIARTNWVARRWVKLLDEAGIPWVPTRGGGGWKAPVRNQAAAALLSIENHGPISGADWVAIIKHVPSKAANGEALIVRGTKKRFETPTEAEKFPWVMPQHLDQLGATAEFYDAVSRGEWKAWVKGSERYVGAVKRYGLEAVEEPRVRVGTVHSVKGAEADNVALITDVPQKIKKSMTIDPDCRDEERRVAYVAVTRARRNLFLCVDNCQSAKMPI